MIQLLITCGSCGHEERCPWSMDVSMHVVELHILGWIVPWRFLSNGQPVRIKGEQLCPKCREARGLPPVSSIAPLGIRRNSPLIVRSEAA